MAAANYTDLATVEDELGVVDTSIEGRLNRAITDASRFIDWLCHVRQGMFAPQTFTWTFDVDKEAGTMHFPVSDNTKGWQSRVFVPPLLSVTTLQTSSNGDGNFDTTWSAGNPALPYGGSNPRDYILLPWNDEVKREIVVDPLNGRYGFTPGPGTLQITGSWGFTEDNVTPYPIRRACLLLVARYYRRADAPFAMLGDPAIGMQRISQTDPDVAALLYSVAGKAREHFLAA
jgi:hypothetical protein